MRINNISASISLVVLSVASTAAFTLTNPRAVTQPTITTQLHALTAKDILARARKAVGQPEEEDDESPQIFDDATLEDMQQSLLMFEKRVKEGPGSLSEAEVLKLETMTGNIVTELNNFIKNGGEPPSKPAPSEASISAGAPSIPEEQAEALVTPRNAAPGGEAKSLVDNLPAALGSQDREHNDEEGEDYDGTGGLGLAKGTVNTYVLPGMDEMTGEEYRAALQKSVIERQAKRRDTGVTGNLSSQNYLDNL